MPATASVEGATLAEAALETEKVTNAPAVPPPLPPALVRAVASASEWLQSLDAGPVGAKAGLETLRQRLGGPLPKTGTDPARVIEELVEGTSSGHHASAGGRFFAWVIGGSLTSALAADWLTSAWDENATLYACGPAAAVVEEVAGEWIKELLDLPPAASFAFTSGCQLAHFTALAAARYAVLQRFNWDVTADGLHGAPPIRILVSEQRHGSVDRALRFLGFGARQVELLATDRDGRVLPAALLRAMTARGAPTIVVLNAADLNIAAFDSFAELTPIAREAGAWVHVDGAFGLFARASRARRALVHGVEAADSWATDGHKWLNVPFDCGIAVVRDREAHRAAMSIRAAYLPSEGQARDQIDWTPEWSRRARGYAVYAALRELGRDGVEDVVDRTCALCHTLVMALGKLPGAEILWSSALNQGLLRFHDPRPGATDLEHDQFTDAAIAAINATGVAFFSGTTWRGRRAMRVSVVNWRTNESDVERTVKAARMALESLRAR